MKKLKDFIDEEKIKLFDEIYSICLEEINEAVKDEEWDTQYFWEAMMNSVLKLDEADWNKHNDGKKLR